MQLCRKWKMAVFLQILWCTDLKCQTIIKSSISSEKKTLHFTSLLIHNVKIVLNLFFIKFLNSCFNNLCLLWSSTDVFAKYRIKQNNIVLIQLGFFSFLFFQVAGWSVVACWPLLTHLVITLLSVKQLGEYSVNRLMPHFRGVIKIHNKEINWLENLLEKKLKSTRKKTGTLVRIN